MDNGASRPFSLWALCRGDPATLCAQLAQPGRAALLYATIIVIGAGLYGATIGLWRAPAQAVFAAIKFPLVILLTTAANALLNGMLSLGLGLPIGFRDASLLIAASFAITAAILGALSPVTLFLLANTPALGAGNAVISHNALLLTHVALIALAGYIGNAALFRALVARTGRRGAAALVLTAWLAGNLFLGAQLSWILRPFIGAPQLPVAFLRPDAFAGNFYESFWRSLTNVLVN